MIDTICDSSSLHFHFERASDNVDFDVVRLLKV